ncbi:hypothetical protein EVAR_79453_1 [Eumeta japonica]|uniref:Uncharacterized protein n=1 Tax=Eumeta variegata TaxID=151549 RepID=A0A4C1UDM9_EUMVA|nr:hypothetical protein EVAR_79453_1 [Eumeta japonica]
MRPARPATGAACKEMQHLRYSISRIIMKFFTKNIQIYFRRWMGEAKSNDRTAGELCVFGTEPESRSGLESESKVEAGLKSKEGTTSGHESIHSMSTRAEP